MNQPMIRPLTKEKFLAEYRIKLKEVQDLALQQEQIQCPVTHNFAPNVYMRQILMPAGSFIIGKTHKTEHFNIILAGSAEVMIDGVIQFIQAPFTFTSKAGAKKVLRIHEEMIWATIHPTEETDIEKLEELFVFTEEEERIALEQEIKKLNME
jgi:hypothetical protein